MTPLRARGFTLIEVIVVMALVAIVGGLALIPGLKGYQGTLFYTDRNMLITALQRARAEAVGNICYGSACVGGVPHGVHVETDAGGKVSAFVIFQDTYSAGDPTNQSIPAAGSTYHSGVTEVLFEQLSGDASVNPAVSEPWNIVLSDSAGHTSDVTVGTEGQIFWTH